MLAERFSKGTYCLISLLDLKRLRVLTKQERNVFDILLEHLRYENKVVVRRQTIIDELKMKKQNVSQVLQRLQKHDFIKIGPKGQHKFVLNPQIVYKGNIHDEYGNYTLKYIKSIGS